MLEVMEETASGGNVSKEGSRPGDSSTTNCAESAVIEHYLTFETPLPIPSCFEINGLRGADMPELNDCVSPFTWSKSRKRLTTWLCCASTLIAAYTAGSYGPPSKKMMDYFGVSQIAILVGITTFTSGFAIAPMFLVTASELTGRKPMFIYSGILFFICQLSCGLTQSYPGMLVARFWAGVGSSTYSTMVGGIISDIYHPRGMYRRFPGSNYPQMTNLSQIGIRQWLFFLERYSSQPVWAHSALASLINILGGVGYFTSRL